MTKLNLSEEWQESGVHLEVKAAALARPTGCLALNQGEVSEFLLDTSWNPDDVDGASETPSVDAPQFESLYEPEVESDLNWPNVIY